MRPEPKTRMMLSQEYWEMTSVMGTMLRKALAMAGINAVMVISTGLVIHQKIIHRETPIACAPAVPNTPVRPRLLTMSRIGPIRR